MLINWRKFRFCSIRAYLAALLFLLLAIGAVSYFGFGAALLQKAGLFPFIGAETDVVAYRAERVLRIPEGWTVRRIGQYLESQGPWSAARWQELVGDPNPAQDAFVNSLKNRFDFLKDKPAEVGLEGYLFPDTYRVHASSTEQEIVITMLSNFAKKLDSQLRSDLKDQERTVHEIITMASLIEREAPLSYSEGADNRDAYLISGIFWKRLSIGQALQSDATLSYILNDNKPAHSGAELEVDSPYNTYKYPGLPPGPINNPSLLAIRAAIYPKSSDYYYFLTPADEKIVVYGRTYQEHLRNKYKYLK